MKKVICLSILGCWLLGLPGMLIGVGAGLILDDLSRGLT